MVKLLFPKKTMNIPLIFLFSMIPDIDVFLRGVRHRGPTHSLIVPFLLVIPSYLIFKEKMFPYFTAYVSHLISDYFSGRPGYGSRLLWPLTNKWIPIRLVLNMDTRFETGFEILLFFIMLVIYFHPLITKPP
jgi:membrane-bound metal-dependent hydrolase YbcI (DUF457 family)